MHQNFGHAHKLQLPDIFRRFPRSIRFQIGELKIKKQSVSEKNRGKAGNNAAHTCYNMWHREGGKSRRIHTSFSNLDAETRTAIDTTAWEIKLRRATIIILLLMYMYIYIYLFKYVWLTHRHILIHAHRVFQCNFRDDCIVWETQYFADEVNRESIVKSKMWWPTKW